MKIQKYWNIVKQKMKSTLLLFFFITTTITTTTTNAFLFSKSKNSEEPCEAAYLQQELPTNQNSSIACTPTSTNCPRLSLCYELFCICRMGYEWDPGSSSCQPHHCSADGDCYAYYPHTRCVDAVCVCDDVSRFCPINQACVYLPDSAHYLIAIFAMAGGFVLVSVATTLLTYWWTRRKYRKRRRGETSVNQRENLVKNGGTVVPNYQTISTVKSHYPEI